MSDKRTCTKPIWDNLFLYLHHVQLIEFQENGTMASLKRAAKCLSYWVNVKLPIYKVVTRLGDILGKT